MSECYICRKKFKEYDENEQNKFRITKDSKLSVLNTDICVGCMDTLFRNFIDLLMKDKWYQVRMNQE